MTVFEQHTLHMDMGKSILFKYEKTGDAQALHNKLEEYMVQSTSVGINSDNILTHLSTSIILYLTSGHFLSMKEN